jgi:hypothetical protein
LIFGPSFVYFVGCCTAANPPQPLTFLNLELPDDYC